MKELEGGIRDFPLGISAADHNPCPLFVKSMIISTLMNELIPFELLNNSTREGCSSRGCQLSRALFVTITLPLQINNDF